MKRKPFVWLFALLAAAALVCGCAEHHVHDVPVYTSAPANPTAPPIYSYNQNVYQPAPGALPPVAPIEPAPPAEAPASTAPPPSTQPAPAPPAPGAAVTAPAAPPAVQTEVVPVAPGPEYVWAPGYWSWNGHWVWVTGSWVLRPRPHAVWVGGHWAHRGHGYIWIGGYWR